MGNATDAGAIYLVDKPAGPTSHDIVAAIRRRMPKGTKVGHAGTLDPFATGLLVVAVGRATRLLQFLTDHDKTYLARVQLGATSATGDPEGPIVATGAPPPTQSAIAAAVANLPGQHEQRVPSFSAVKVDGEPMYRRARRGEEVPQRSRTITIAGATLVASDDDGKWFDLQVTCSKGTYIRQLAVDLGEDLGVGGYCERLRRLAVGDMSIDAAAAPERVPQQGGIDPLVALAPMPQIAIDAAAVEAVRHGRAIPGEAAGPVALVVDGTIAAIAQPTGHGELRPKVVLA